MVQVAQKCPVCDGTGKNNDGWSRPNKAPEPCTVCKGQKIISPLTGKSLGIISTE